MLKWMRRLRISLAVKCQLLFGSAVVLIIGAALFVPWRRMQQLTDQLNEKSADAVAQYVVAQHVATYRGLESAVVPQKVEPASDEPTTQPVAAQGQVVAPRMLSVDGAKSPRTSTRFEHGAINRFINDPDRRVHDTDYLLPDGSWGYRYAVALYARQECVSCHAGPVAQAAVNGPYPSMPIVATPATRPTTDPAAGTAIKKLRPQLLGLVSVDIESQVSTNELLLNHVFILTAGLVAGTLAIVTLYMIITRLILQPVRVLQDAAERVAQGDLNIRSDISSGDEFQQLSETFNTMLVNLKTSADQLRAVNKSLDLRLGQLAETNVALYESNRLKSEFLANVSHELRTPLNSILGFAELLRDLSASAPPAGADGKSTRYVQNILSSANHLLTLINDLLDLAKIEAGRMEIRPEPLSLPDVFEGLVSLLKPLTEAKRLTIQTSVSPGVPIIHTDPAKLQQVLYNFLSNAIKFSPPDATIDLDARREIDTDRVRIEVADRGPGIEPGQQDVIFEKFRQIDGSVTRQHGGSGLGLAISKELINLMGGSIGVRSAPGEGATFWITLPLKIEAGAKDVRSRMVLT